MGGNSGEEHVLLDRYIAIVDSKGVNSQEARAFREAQPELSEVFQNIDRMEAAGQRARILHSVVRALWVGTFLMLAGIGIAGFRQGVNLGSAQTQLADSQTELGDVQTQLASVESQFQTVEAERTTLVAQLKALQDRMQETDFGKISAELAKTELELSNAKIAQAQMTAQIAKFEDAAVQAEANMHATAAELIASEGAAKDARSRLEKMKAEFDLVMSRATSTARDGAAARGGDEPRGEHNGTTGLLSQWQFPGGRQPQQCDPDLGPAQPRNCSRSEVRRARPDSCHQWSGHWRLVCRVATCGESGWVVGPKGRPRSSRDPRRLGAYFSMRFFARRPVARLGCLGPPHVGCGYREWPPGDGPTGGASRSNQNWGTESAVMPNPQSNDPSSTAAFG